MLLIIFRLKTKAKNCDKFKSKKHSNSPPHLSKKTQCANLLFCNLHISKSGGVMTFFAHSTQQCAP